MAYCYVVTGTRGSGKGAFSVVSIKDVLADGNRVATNMLLFMQHLGTDHSFDKVTRLPDFPTGKHLYQLGKAYDFDPNDPSTIDPSKEGLLLLDEASLYLYSAREKDFADLVKYLVLSRKLGWNILIVCQNKDQLQDTIYKSLADKLIVCRDNVNFRVPFMTGFLEKFGLENMIKDSHSAFVFSGRSELDALEKEIPFKNRPHRLCYSTAQLFSDQKEFLNDEFVDMRANYTYLPNSYLNGNVHLQRLDKEKERISQIYTEKVEDMAAPKGQGFSTGEKIKIVGLVAGLIAFFYFSNPLDNKYIADIVGEEEPVKKVASAPVQTSIQTEKAIPVQVSSVPVTPQLDFIQHLFMEFRPNLSAYVNSPVNGPYAVIDFYSGGQLYERLTIDDFHRFGYSVTPSGKAVMIKGNGFQKRVTTWNFQKFEGNTSNDNLAIASRLK